MKDFFNLLRRLFEGLIGFIAAFCSILSLLLLIFNNQSSSIIALISFNCFLAIILYRVLRILNTKISEKYPEGWLKNSTFINYSTDDAKLIKYEHYKNIQCKALIKDRYTHEFNWRGTNFPINIDSRMQRLEIEKSVSNKDYSKIHCYFYKPLRYNECETIHFSMVLDDSDQKSPTHIGVKITYPTKLVHFRVSLKYLTNEYNKNAVLYKRPIDTNLPYDFRPIEEINFDTDSKIFEYHLRNPEVGYFYRLGWERY